MAAFETTTDTNNRPVDIDLTLPDTQPPDGNTSSALSMNIDAALGSSADKPIELDLDSMDIDMTNMSDLFGDAVDSGSTDANASLFSPPTAVHELPSQDGKLVKQENLGMELLDALSDAEGHDDLFASFSQSNSQPSGQNQSQPNVASDGLSVPVDPTSPGTVGVPSPNSILASFTTSQMNATDQSSSLDAHNLAAGGAPFDLDSIFNGEPGSESNMAEIEELLKSGGFGSSA